MSLAIKFGDITDNNSVAGVIYFDAVTAYGRKYGGKVSEHPLESGASITDHYISHNKKFGIKGVISGVDFSVVAPNTLIDGQPIFNRNSNPPAVTIPPQTLLDKFNPNVVEQFLSAVASTPVLSGNSKSYNKEIEQMLAEILHGLYYNEERKKWESRITLTMLFDVDGPSPTLLADNLAITTFNISEDVKSGDGLFFDMSLEQINFVSLETAEAPKGGKTGRATTPKKNAGNANSSNSKYSKMPLEKKTALGQFTKAGE